MEWGSDRSKEVSDTKSHTRAELISMPPQIIDKKALSLKRLAADGKDTPGGRMAHSLRSLGSAALNFAHVATGQLDMYQEIGCWSWDVCAGIVIAREAGGKVCDCHRQDSVGADRDIWSRSTAGRARPGPTTPC